MLDPSDLEAPRRLFLPRLRRGRTIASVLPAAAIVAGAPTTQQRIVGVYIPARWTRERQIVQGNSLDFPLHRDQKIANERWQLVILHVVHAPRAVQPILTFPDRGPTLLLLENSLVQSQRCLQIVGRKGFAPGLAPGRLLPLLHGHRGDDLGASLHFGAALVAGKTRRVVRVACPRSVRFTRFQFRLPRAHARRRSRLHHRVAAVDLVLPPSLPRPPVRALALEAIDRAGLLATMLEHAALLARPRARLLARTPPGPHALRGARRLRPRQAAARRVATPLPLSRHLPPVHELLLAVPAEETWGPHRRRSPNYCNLNGRQARC